MFCICSTEHALLSNLRNICSTNVRSQLCTLSWNRVFQIITQVNLDQQDRSRKIESNRMNLHHVIWLESRILHSQWAWSPITIAKWHPTYLTAPLLGACKVLWLLGSVSDCVSLTCLKPVPLSFANSENLSRSDRNVSKGQLFPFSLECNKMSCIIPYSKYSVAAEIFL